jgi:hypothetical protein
MGFSLHCGKGLGKAIRAIGSVRALQVGKWLERIQGREGAEKNYRR